ncbi:MAG: aldehyde dehydrogenase family protein [Desulfobacterales bacterium]|nr:aldehyde dehydrogenase family protein [Desulfobacterales bacterium]
MESPKKNDAPDTFIVCNPATGEKVGEYKQMNKQEVHSAAARAREKFPAWSASTFKDRQRILGNAASILSENAEKYADVIAGETGKTRLDAMLADIFSFLDLLKYYKKNAGKFLKPVRAKGNLLFPGRKAYYRFEPKGVVGVISPWNYPFTLMAGPALSAIAAGNTVVLKPSSQTTESGLIFKEIMEKAGLPEGVVNVVTGSGGTTGQALLEAEELDMFFFTGSTAVGKTVQFTAAERMIPAIMELGGKDVAIVTKNANLDRAAHGVVWGGITNSGQTCIGTELVLVDRAVYAPLVDKVVALVNVLESGSGPGEVGSMTMKSQLRIVERQVADAVEKGARVLTGGISKPGRKGMYYPPTVIVDTQPHMKVRTEETFGPLLPIIPYDHIDEAVRVANKTDYGLSGAVFTKDMAEGRSIAKRLKTGSVNINDVLITYAIPSLPFGGVKQSGVGAYHGKAGLRAFTDVKSVTEFNWDLKKEIYWYPIPKRGEQILSAAFTAIFSGNPSKKLAAALRLAAEIWKLRKS